MTFAKKHGKAGHGIPEYEAWKSMIQRCHNPTHKAFARYGGRGIVVCAEWRRNFVAFLDHVGCRPSDRYTLDRFPDNNGNYEPGNVRWATRTQQACNTRSNRIIEWRGRRLCVAQWERELGLSENTLYMRLRAGMSLERAMQARDLRAV